MERSFVVEWLAVALFLILRLSASNLVPETYRDMTFMVFFHNTSRQIMGIVPEIISLPLPPV